MENLWQWEQMSQKTWYVVQGQTAMKPGMEEWGGGLEFLENEKKS